MAPARTPRSRRWQIGVAAPMSFIARKSCVVADIGMKGTGATYLHVATL